MQSGELSHVAGLTNRCRRRLTASAHTSRPLPAAP